MESRLSQSPPSPRHLLTGLAVSFGATFVAAFAGSYASLQAKTFYAELVRPPWAPPGWLFGPVWTVLYLMIGASAFLIWKERNRAEIGPALRLHLAQLALNGLWTWIFFVGRNGFLAFAEILVLWLLIGATVRSFHRLRPAAAWLLLPYWAWVTFATALTLACWRLNPNLL